MADLIRAGGMVMVPLVVLSLVMWLLIIERAFFFQTALTKKHEQQHRPLPGT